MAVRAGGPRQQWRSNGCYGIAPASHHACLSAMLPPGSRATPPCRYGCSASKRHATTAA